MNRYTVVYKSILALVVIFVLFSFSESSINNHKNITKKKIVSVLKSNLDVKIEEAYNTLQSNQFELPKQSCFSEALKGFYSLQDRGIVKSNILTLIDFSLSSNVKRLWIIDLSNNIVLLQTLVAHGRNTGEEFATAFSNRSESFKSSLGLYVTGEVYRGKHGISLRLDGLEKGINDNARNRAVVLHGADYVSESFIKNNKRLGRSLGCPAVPVELTSKIIETIKGQSCLYIYHSSIDNSKQHHLIS